MSKMKSAIVTGASGFLGSHLVEHLINRGYFVIGFDNFSTGLKTNIQYLRTKFNHSKFLFVEFDCCKKWSSVLNGISRSKLKNLEYIFHFASPASPPLYQKLSVETIHVNTIGLERAIHCANHFGAKVIFASTSEVYGDPNISPQPEKYWGNVNSYGERSCYDEAKRCGEAILHSYNFQRNLNDKNPAIKKHGLVRIFNTYGPRMNPRDGRVVINFLVQGLKGADLTIHGDGSQTRSFCYVDDLIEGILLYAQSDLHEPVNLGNPSEFTILQLAKKVQTIFHEKNLKIRNLPLPGDDPLQRRPDISKAIRFLEPWKPKIPLDQGLVKMLEWLKTQKI